MWIQTNDNELYNLDQLVHIYMWNNEILGKIVEYEIRATFSNSSEDSSIAGYPIKEQRDEAFKNISGLINPLGIYSI